MNVPPSKKAKTICVAPSSDDQKTLMEGKVFFERLASSSDVIVQSDKSGIPSDAVASILAGVEIFIPLEELIDIEKEIERLNKELANLEKELDRVNKKLGNEGFISKAPAKVIEEEKEKKAKYQEMYDKVAERLKGLQNKA
jgi:valyl-tRNA synthetase